MTGDGRQMTEDPSSSRCGVTTTWPAYHSLPKDQFPSGDMSFDSTTSTDDLNLEDDLNYDEKWRAFGRLILDMPLFFPNYYVSLIGRLKVKPAFLGPVFIAGGFRYDNIKIDYQDVDIDAEFYGPFAEVGLEF